MSRLNCSHSRKPHETDSALVKAGVPSNAYFGTLSLLEEPTADVSCDRYARVRERALISLAALAKKKVPVAQCTLSQAYVHLNRC